MKAIVLKSFGGPSRSNCATMPKPVPQAGRSAGAGACHVDQSLDYQVRRGDYPDLVPLADHHRPRCLGA